MTTQNSSIKILAILAIAILAILLVSCDNGNSGNSGNSSQSLDSLAVNASQTMQSVDNAADVLCDVTESDCEYSGEFTEQAAKNSDNVMMLVTDVLSATGVITTTK